MDTIHPYDPMIRYHLWATDKVHDALTRTRPLVQPTADLFAHMVNAEQMWMQRIGWMERRPEVLFPENADFSKAEETWHSVRPVWERILKELEHMALEEEIEYTNSEGKTHRDHIGDILLHLLNHATHHRSQVNVTLRRAGFEPPVIDYIAWLRQA
jgi:uncharacterized damage-inducible protein DinB